MPDVEGIPLVPAPSQQFLNQRQVIDYRHHREELINWMLHLGKEPEQAVGYSHATVERRAHDLDKFYRFVWDQRGRYTLDITTDDADDYVRELVYADCSNSHKKNKQKALKMYFRWCGDEWEPEITISGDDGGHTQPRDFLTRKERRAIREAALEYGSVPNYNALSPAERDEWMNHLAIRLRKPASEVGPDDFEKACGFKIPSLVHVGLDAGLRPEEVGRAKVSWCDTQNGILRVPADESVKNRDHWPVSLRDRTATLLEQWLDERHLYDKYDESDRIWLNREGNAYYYKPLKYLLRRLCDVANISYENRDMTWYAVRHSTGTFMTREDGLKSAATQLRRKTLPVRYDQTPPDERRSALEQID